MLLERLLSMLDLSREPQELFREVRKEIEKVIQPGWLAFYHRSPESGTIHCNPELTSAELLSLLPERGDRIGIAARPEYQQTLYLPKHDAPGVFANLLGTDGGALRRVLRHRSEDYLAIAPVMQGSKQYGYLFVGISRRGEEFIKEAIEVFRGVLGHLCYVLDVLSYERTRSTAFHTQAVPSFLTTGEGTLLEVNDAFRTFFALPGEARIEEQHLSAFFSFHADGGLQALLKRDSLARPAVAAFLPDRPRISGVLHSLAGARTPDGTQMRYFYFLPDEAAATAVGSGESIKRSYPTLDLPEKLSLTAREIDVAVRIAAGESSKDIADRLNVSIRTVQFHRQSLRDKLGIVGRGLSLRHALLRYERAVS